MDQQPQWPLSNEERQKYMAWLLRSGTNESNDYNMPQFFQASEITGDPRYSSSVNPNDQKLHFPDAFKMPNHPTFSTDSNYYDSQLMPQTPTWEGGPLPDGRNESWTLRRPSGEVIEQENPFSDALIRALRSKNGQA